MLKRLVVMLIVVALAGVGAMARAQEQNVAQGQLLRLDTSARRIVIKTATGSQMQFEYTDTTVVNGADASVQGLGTKTGTLVKVQYEKQETRLLAVQVDVQQK